MRPLWALGYELLARAFTAYLTRGEPGSAAYARAGLGLGRALYGLSDIDTAVVVGGGESSPGTARARVRDRRDRFCHTIPLCGLLIDSPLVFEQSDLEDAVRASTLTYGLEDAGAAAAAPAAVYSGPASDPDKVRLQERPGLYGATHDWRLLSGPNRRPKPTPRDSQEKRIAGWLELQFLWRWAFMFCAWPDAPRAASVCVKMASEPARIWLWLERGVRVGGAREALERALLELPGEEHGLLAALKLQEALPLSPRPPLAASLRTLNQLSERVAHAMTRQVAPQGETLVRLSGAADAELTASPPAPGHAPEGEGACRPALLPLVDWRALCRPTEPEDVFGPISADPDDPDVIRCGGRSASSGPYPAIVTGSLLIFPGQEWPRSALRSVNCQLTDPVSFALAAGHREARFPRVRGWSAHDWAHRAVAEHRAWLAAERPRSARGQLGTLLGAARAAFFMESVKVGDPELPVTAAATVDGLSRLVAGGRSVAEEALHCHRSPPHHVRSRTERIVARLEAVVRTLPPYADTPLPPSRGDAPMR